MTKRLRILGALLLALGVAGIGSSHPAYAAGSPVADCTFITLQTDLQKGGDWYYPANQCSAPISFAGTITLGSNVSLTAQGTNVTLDGGGSFQLFSVNSGVTFGLTGLVLSNGNGSFGGAIYNNDGTVTITNSILSGNSASRGGAIYSGASLTLTNTTLSNNSALYGGAIFNAGTAAVNDSTLSANSTGPSDGLGGAILNQTGDTLTVDESTFSGNSAGPGYSWGGAIYNNDGTVRVAGSTLSDNSAYQGGAIYNFGAVGIRTSIVADSGGGNCVNSKLDTSSAAITDNGYNLETGTDCGFTGMGSLQNKAPLLGALSNNGGPTQTMALGDGSPAIDQIPAASCAATDQRGTLRPDGTETSCDIGAYEYQDPTTLDQTITFTSTAPNSAVYGATYTPTATASSGLVVTFGAGGACSYDSGTGTVTMTAIGTCTVTADQGGGSGYNPASPATQVFTVGPAPASLSIEGTSLSQTYDGSPESVTVDTTPNNLSGVSVSYAGTGGTSYGPSTTPPTNAGSYSVAASLNNANFTATGATGTLAIGKASTTTTVTSSVASSLLHQSVTFTAMVSSGAGTPGGTVTFNDGSTTLVTGLTLDGAGKAAWTTSGLSAGTHFITASYSGNPNFKGNTSSMVSQQVGYSVKVLSVSSLTMVLQLQDISNVNVSASSLPVTTECVLAYTVTAPTTCGTSPIQTLGKAFSFLNSYRGQGAAYSYSVNSRGLTKRQQYDLVFQADGDPTWHAVPFTF